MAVITLIVELMDEILTGLFALALLLLAYYLFRVRAPHEGARRLAEDKVRNSDRISRYDIEVLARTNSSLLDDAIALRYAQMKQGRRPGD